MSESTSLEPSIRRTFYAVNAGLLIKSFLVCDAILGSVFGLRGLFCPAAFTLPPATLTSSKSYFGGYLLMPFGLTCFLTIFAVNSERAFAISCTLVFVAAVIGFYYIIEVFVNKSEDG